MESEGYENNTGIYKLLNTSQSILISKLNSLKGRIFISSKNYKYGEIILIEKSYCHIIPSKNSNTVCAVCGIIPSNNQIYGISIDDPIRYCSQECLLIDTNIHSNEIKALKLTKELGIDGGNDPCLLLVRIAALRKLEKKDKKEKRLKSINLPLVGR